MKKPFKDFLTHRTTLRVSGIVAVVVLGAVFVARAMDPIQDITVKSMTNIVVTLAEPAKSVKTDGVYVIDAEANYLSTTTTVTTEGKLDVITKEALVEGASYELLIKGGALEPINTTDYKKAFVAKVANTCSDTITLNSVNPTYKSTIGDITFDMKAKLISPALYFSIDKINREMGGILLDTKPSVIYVSNDGGKSFITLSNTKIELNGSVIFDVAKDCNPTCEATKTITLDLATQEYQSSVGIIAFDGNVVLQTKDGITMFSKDQLTRTKGIDVSGLTTVYATNDGGKSSITLSNVKLNKGVNVAFDVAGNCPVDEMCTVINTLNKEMNKFTTPLGTIEYDGQSKLASTMDKGEIYLSLDDIKYETTIDLNRALTPQTLYLKDMKTQEKISYTNFLFDAKALTVSFDTTRPVNTDIILSPEKGLTYMFAEKEALIYDGGTYIRGEGIELSLDGGKSRVGEYKNEVYPATLLVRSKAIGTTTELTKVALDLRLRTLAFTIAKPCIVDTDKDGVEDKNDDCPNVFGKKEFNGCTALLRVSVEENVNGTHQDTALETKVFDANAGSCVATISAQPQNYAQIRDKCTAELTKKETMSQTIDGKKPQNLISELVRLGVTKGTKLVLVKSQASIDGSFGYMGFDLPDMLEGQSRDIGFNVVPGQDLNFVQTSIFTKDSKGFRQSLRRSQVIKGSELQIFQPDYALWNGTEQVYPFMFISDSDWNVDICLEVPQGYKIVEPGKCSQTLISNETKIVEFVAVETGSPKDFDVGAKLKVKHKGKTTNVDLKVKSHNPNAK